MSSIVGPHHSSGYRIGPGCKYILTCKNFYTASRYAAEQNWALREWFWVAGTTSYVKRYDRVSL